MKKEQEEILYEEVFTALNKEKIEYAVCGGLAVVLYGYTRLTIDLDLIVSLEKENLENLYDLLIHLNYKPQIPIKRAQFINKVELERLDEEKNMKVVSFYNSKDPMGVIDICVNLPMVEELLRRKKQIKVNNLKIPIISIKDLIKMKEDLARPRDITDAENLKKIKKEERY